MVASNNDKRKGPAANRGARKNRNKDVSWEKRLEIARAKRAAILAERGEQPVIPAVKPWDDQQSEAEPPAADAPAADTAPEPDRGAEGGRDYVREAILQAALARRAQTLARKGQEPDAREREALEGQDGKSANVFPLFIAESSARTTPETAAPERSGEPETKAEDPTVPEAAAPAEEPPAVAAEPVRQPEIDTAFAARFRSVPEEEDEVDDLRTHFRRASMAVLLLVTGAAAGFWGATLYFTELHDRQTPAREIPIEGEGGVTPNSSSSQGRVKQALDNAAPTVPNLPESAG